MIYFDLFIFIDIKISNRYSTLKYFINYKLNILDNGVLYDVARTKQLIEDKKRFWKKMLLNKY